MNIIHIISSMDIGGAQRLLADLLPLQMRNHHVTLLVMKSMNNDFTETIKAAGIDIISVGTESYYSLRNIPKLIKMTRGYDIIHLHLTHALYGMAVASLFETRTMLVTEHSTYGRLREKKYMRWIERWVYGRCKCIVSISPETQSSIQSWIHDCSASRYVVIENGVNLSHFKLKSTSVNRSLIMVSRFALSKDQPTVIRALQFLPKDVKVRFVGDSVTMDNCKKLVHKFNLDSRVEFLGYRTDIPQLIAESYIGIQSSNWEGFGLSAVELMAAGKPVVVSDVDGLRQVVEGAGLVFKHANEHDLAEKINQLLSDDAYYNKVASACMKRASKYDISVMVKKYEKIYDRLIR